MLKLGTTVDNRILQKLFAVGNMGGMRRSKRKNALVIISDETKPLYKDRWRGSVLHYTGMGKSGDQSLKGNQNQTLYNSRENGVSIHLFEVFERGRYTYAGEVTLSSVPYREMQRGENGRDRLVWMFPLKTTTAKQNNIRRKPFSFAAAENKRALLHAAREMSDALRQLPLPLKFYTSLHLEVCEPTSGWSIEIASWRGMPSIGLSLDFSLKQTKPNYWYGFWSRQRDRIEALRSAMPAHLKSRIEVHNQNIRRVNNSPRKTTPPSAQELRAPVTEFYHREYYFGLYELKPDNREPRHSNQFATRFINEVIQEYLNRKYRDGLTQTERDLAEVEDSNFDPTTKKRLVDARLGQGAYRRELERIWRRRCAVSECDVKEILRASHIKPWKLSDRFERLDSNNGLLLSAHYDALFDKNLISFTDNGEMKISQRVSRNQRSLLGLPKALSRPLNSKQKMYLAHHRRNLAR